MEINHRKMSLSSSIVGYTFASVQRAIRTGLVERMKTKSEAVSIILCRGGLTPRSVSKVLF